MKYFLGVLLIVLAVAAYFLFSTPCTIEGRLFRSDTRKPFVSVQVQLWTLSEIDKEPYLASVATTNQDGDFTFKVTPGVYRVVAGVQFDSESQMPQINAAEPPSSEWKIARQSLLVGGSSLIATTRPFKLLRGDTKHFEIDVCVNQ
jgi:hypothetical protein